MISYHRLLVGLAAGDELGRAIPLRADPLATPDVRLKRLVAEHAVQGRGSQLYGGGGDGVTIKEALGLDHQPTQVLGVGRLEEVDGLMDDALVNRAQQGLHALLNLIDGEGIGVVQVG